MLAKHSQGSDSLLQVTAPATGRLGKVAVTIGSVVRVGDVLAEIDQKELGDEVASATAELARLREEDARMNQLDDDEARSKAEAERELEASPQAEPGARSVATGHPPADCRRRPEPEGSPDG